MFLIQLLWIWNVQALHWNFISSLYILQNLHKGYSLHFVSPYFLPTSLILKKEK
jgi:hypothetical protein